MFNYQEFLDTINRQAYHEGEFQWEEDGYVVTRTNHWSPPGCHNSCGLLIYTKDGKFAKIEGDPLSPFVNGKLCVRCLDMAEAIHNPNRLKYPMKRAGKRGENKWQRISWEEAFAICEREVRRVWDQYGGSSILLIHGTGRNTGPMTYFGNCALKTPNIATYGFTGFACYLPRLFGAFAPVGDYMIADASEGSALRYANPEFKAPEVLVVWGNEPLKSNADGYIGHWLVPLIQNGTKIISIDPRLTWWGARADYFLQIRPGTDAALACAWLNVIINEKLYDQEFVEKWCTGFDELAASVQEFTPAWAAEICGLAEEDIIASARVYAAAKPASIQWGLAMDQQMSSMSLNLACCDLMAITGNLDVPGGNILIRNAFNAMNIELTENAIPEEWRAQKLTMKYAFGDNAEEFTTHAASDAVLKAMESGQPIPIKLCWIETSNTLACPSMDVGRVYEAFKNVEFIVNADPFVTPVSAAFADLILPVSMSAERDSCRTWWTPLRTINKTSQYYEAKSDEEIMLEMGRRLNPVYFPWKDVIAFLDWYMTDCTVPEDPERKEFTSTNLRLEADKANRPTNKLGFSELSQAGGFAYDEWNAVYRKYEKGLCRPDGSVGFATESGKIELTPIMYEIWGLRPTPYHIEPPESPLSTPEKMKEYPLILTCGGRSWEFFHSENRQMPTMRELHPEPLVTINPHTAAKYGIKDGDYVWIENDHGRFRQKAFLSPTVNEQTVHAEHGWWFPEQDGASPNFFGTFDANPNNCTKAYETGPAGIGTSIKCMICRIYPYKEGDKMPHTVVVEEGGFFQYTPGQGY
ncbi:molybdopterin-dependent oxidoreductase [Dehalobacter sp. DCM]|uniref:molybdopterin-dependent oxidoreductase n=1 Tax=Dehalobacter sp. DCM TaxID=2907827 RepID=UPI003081944A|nr:molybdopterin-dependent oxidoreductase [Dehalobacter sp. DCM]